MASIKKWNVRDRKKFYAYEEFEVSNYAMSMKKLKSFKNTTTNSKFEPKLSKNTKQSNFKKRLNFKSKTI